ncbi:MAG: hypothetical protein AABX70_01030 [Nanoarchaeota archaeon]
MNILDNLKKIFETKFRDLFSNNKIDKIVIFDFSKNPKNVLELKEDNRLSIDLSKATDEEKKSIKKNVIDVIVQGKNEVFLGSKSLEKTKQIKSNLPNKEDEELLKFYKDKLKPSMNKALEVSLIIRKAFKNGEDIKELKRDISYKFPNFGNNLCNLTSSDYFHDHFRKLYESMLLDDDFDINIYQKKVEKIVISLPYTVFITRFKSYDQLSGEVKFKLEKLKKYGTGTLLLHGLGKENVNTALQILEEYKDDKSITIEIELNQTKTIITATLRF